MNYILRRAEKAGKEVYDKAREVIDERELRGSLMLKGFEKEVEVGGVRRDYMITYGRYGADNVVRGFAVARAEADAERLSALVEALTGVKPRICRMKNGAIIIVCSREHLDGFARYAELADAIKKWLLNI